MFACSQGKCLRPLQRCLCPRLLGGSSQSEIPALAPGATSPASPTRATRHPGAALGLWLGRGAASSEERVACPHPPQGQQAAGHSPLAPGSMATDWGRWPRWRMASRAPPAPQFWEEAPLLASALQTAALPSLCRPSWQPCRPPPPCCPPQAVLAQRLRKTAPTPSTAV